MEIFILENGVMTNFMGKALLNNSNTNIRVSGEKTEDMVRVN